MKVNTNPLITSLVILLQIHGDLSVPLEPPMLSVTGGATVAGVSNSLDSQSVPFPALSTKPDGVKIDTPNMVVVDSLSQGAQVVMDKVKNAGEVISGNPEGKSAISPASATGESRASTLDTKATINAFIAQQSPNESGSSSNSTVNQANGANSTNVIEGIAVLGRSIVDGSALESTDKKTKAKVKKDIENFQKKTKEIANEVKGFENLVKDEAKRVKKLKEKFKDKEEEARKAEESIANKQKEIVELQEKVVKLREKQKKYTKQIKEIARAQQSNEMKISERLKAEEETAEEIAKKKKVLQGVEDRKKSEDRVKRLKEKNKKKNKDLKLKIKPKESAVNEVGLGAETEIKEIASGSQIASSAGQNVTVAAPLAVQAKI